VVIELRVSHFLFFIQMQKNAVFMRRKL